MSDKPNVIYFHVDNLGYGELGCYGGGILRGAESKRIDQFARDGFQLMNKNGARGDCVAVPICRDLQLH